MGMFDTLKLKDFYCARCCHRGAAEMQTKLFDCALGEFDIGDRVMHRLVSTLVIWEVGVCPSCSQRMPWGSRDYDLPIVVTVMNSILVSVESKTRDEYAAWKAETGGSLWFLEPLPSLGDDGKIDTELNYSSPSSL